MTKYMVLALLVASSASANVQLPSTLNCSAASQYAPSIKISGLTSGSNSFKIEGIDGSALELSTETYVTRIIGSNQCDNSYTLMLFNSDLEALANGSVKNIVGIQNYSSSIPVEEMVQVTCTL